MRRILFILSFIIYIVNVSAQEQLKFPIDFIIPGTILPSNFVIEPLNDDARQAGVTQNPGIVRGSQFLQGLYENIDINTIESLHIAMYIPKDNPDFELGIYTTAYRSEDDLKRETGKMTMYAGSRYLYKGRYMVRVWGDSGSFETEVNILADYLSLKLGLLEFIPEVKEEDSLDIIEE